MDSTNDRLVEYSPWPEPRSNIPARAGSFVHFLVREFKPFVDRVYRTRPESEWTAVMGASLGGLMPLYLGWRHPDVFGRVGALSPSVMWGWDQLFSEWSSHTRRGSRIYLDAGDDETVDPVGYVMRQGEATRNFHRHLPAPRLRRPRAAPRARTRRPAP